ncbi:VOC family protein [Flavobacteriaceae bacterium S356]|uniref:VOC family protein n=1 Tax=Asprobacillus argus TaxID=3076534 RepID=A0ABU3LF90_9FLAO|nr:VOC family protein [Flavobacteriaceae bacterium S356]
MRKVLVFFALLCVPLVSYTQKNKLPDPEAHFSALIVDNIKTSIDWYSTYLGFTVINERALPDAGFKQANLKRGTILLELIELDAAVSPKEAIPNYTAKTRVKGIFKIGFRISAFNEWIHHLTKLNVEFHGSVVKSNESGKKMVIIKDPDSNRIQLFEK